MPRITFDPVGLDPAKLTTLREALFPILESAAITQPSDIGKPEVEAYLMKYLKDTVKDHAIIKNRKNFVHTPIDLT